MAEQEECIDECLPSTISIPKTCSDISAMIPRRDDVYLSHRRWQDISLSHFEASVILKIPALSGVVNMALRSLCDDRAMHEVGWYVFTITRDFGKENGW